MWRALTNKSLAKREGDLGLWMTVKFQQAKEFGESLTMTPTERATWNGLMAALEWGFTKRMSFDCEDYDNAVPLYEQNVAIQKERGPLHTQRLPQPTSV